VMQTMIDLFCGICAQTFRPSPPARPYRSWPVRKTEPRISQTVLRAMEGATRNEPPLVRIASPPVLYLALTLSTSPSLTLNTSRCRLLSPDDTDSTTSPSFCNAFLCSPSRPPLFQYPYGPYTATSLSRVASVSKQASCFCGAHTIGITFGLNSSCFLTKTLHDCSLCSTNGGYKTVDRSLLIVGLAAIETTPNTSSPARTFTPTPSHRPSHRLTPCVSPRSCARLHWGSDRARPYHLPIL